jgi:zinc and cadmium transporter
MHEIPHHIADVGVLIYGGLTRQRAVLLNFVATLGCGAGGLLVLTAGAGTNSVIAALLPLAAANFIYIATAILLPELQREPSTKRSVLQMASLLGTCLVIHFLGVVFPE